MADAPRGGAATGGARGGFGSRGDRGGDRGRGRGGRRGPRRGGNKSEEKEWQPVTKLGRLVKAGKIKSMEEIYLHSLPIKEYQIVDFFLPKLKDEVMKVSVDHNRYNSVSSTISDGRWLILVSSIADQARAEANPRWSAYPIQGHRCHWRLGRSRRSRHQDLQRSRYSHPRRHHHRQAQCPTNSKRLLGYLTGRPTLSTYEGERQVWLCHCSRTPTALQELIL